MATQFLTAVVTTPGTPQKITASVTPALAAISGLLSGSIVPRGSCLLLQADPSNTAAKNIYIGGSAMNVASRQNIGLALAPATQPVQIFSDGSVDLGDFYIDADTGATTKNLLITIIG